MKLERVKSIYDEISQYEIKLAEDPRSLGPLYLQNMIATCRNYLNLVSRIQLEVHREKQELDRTFRAAETAFSVASSELLANDERVRRLPSIEDRKSAINLLLREQLSAIADLRAQLQDIEYVEKAIRHRHRELTSTMTEIKLQRSLIRDEIDSGAMYGDERKSDHERGPGPGPLGDEIDETEIDALFDKEQEAATKAAPVEEPEVRPVAEVRAEPEPETKLETKPDEAAVKAFLDEPGPKPEAAESEDFAEVFARL